MPAQRLLSQRDEVALHSSDFLGHFQLRTGLVDVRAHPEEHAPRGYGSQVTFLKAMIGFDQMLDAVCLGPESAFVEYIDVDFPDAGLKSADEVAWQANSRDWKLQPAREEQIDGAEANGISGALIDDS